MKLFIVFFLVVYCATVSKAQTKGLVTDGDSRLPLSGVNIYLQKDSVGISTTNNNGYFDSNLLNKFNANDTIVFSYIGFFPVRLTLKELECLGYQVQMHVSFQQLSEVTVQSRYRRKFGNYKSLKSLPRGVHSFGSIIKDGKIYIYSGIETLTFSIPTPFRDIEYLSDKMFIYDIATDIWTKSVHKFIPRYCHTAVYYKGKVFIIGGKAFSTNHKLEYTEPRIEVYDMDKDTVYIDNINPHQAADPITFIYNDCLYVMGGTVKKNKFSSKIHVLDLKTGVWYDTGIDIPKERRDNMKGVLIGETVYFFGGYSTASMWKVRSYNLQTGVWKDLCDLKEGVIYPGLAVNGNLIYIYEKTILQTYNIRTNMIDACYFTEGSDNSGLFYNDGKIYIVGGHQQDGRNPVNNKDDTSNKNTTIESTSVFSVDVSNITSE